MILTTQAAPARAQQQVKPHSDSWQVGSRTFSTTSDLVANADQFDGQAATYRFKTGPDGAPFSSREKVQNIVGGALAGSVPGAAGGALLGGGLVAIAAAADLLNQAIWYAPPAALSAALVLVPAVAGAAIGAVVGAREGARFSPQAPTSQITGQLKTEGDRVAFYPGNRTDQRVDLTSYQGAGEAELVRPESPRPDPIVSSLKGAAVGVGLVGVQIVPLVGVAAPTVVGGMVGEALDKRTLLGVGLGSFAGAALTVGSVALAATGAVSTGSLALGATALLGVTGLALGPSVFARLTEKEPYFDYGQQWWNSKSVEQR